MAPARTVLDKLKTNETAEGEFGWLRPDQTENELEGRRRIRMAPARTILDKLKTNDKAEGEFGWLRPGLDYLRQTENEREGRRTIRMAPARTILDKLEREGWLRPGPSSTK